MVYIVIFIFNVNHLLGGGVLLETALVTIKEWIDYKSQVLDIYDRLVAVNNKYPSPTSDGMVEDCEALLKFVNSYIQHKEDTCK